MNDNKNVVKSIYKLRQNFMIIGLTGRTGSGCSTVAKFLAKDSFDAMQAPEPSKLHNGISNNERKYRIVYNFLKSIWKNKVLNFEVISASDIIFFHVLKDGYEKFRESILMPESEKKDSNNTGQISRFDTYFKDDDKQDFDILSKQANEIYEYLEKKEYERLLVSDSSGGEVSKHKQIAEEYKNFIKNEVNNFRRQFVDELANKAGVKASKWFQYWGNNLRKYGTTYINNESQHDPSQLAETINRIVKLIRALNKLYKKPTFIVIDSLRNPYEVLYFRERYSAFYLMSVSTSEEERRKNLNINYNGKEIEELDRIEYPEKRKHLNDSYFEQDVQKCVEISDIFLTHNNKPVESNDDLKVQLVQYIALMLHPGIIMPTPMERLMQIANTAKLNSGCISRQVGAAICDSNFSMRAIGWNTVPQGQTPCSLRSLDDLYRQEDKSAYSAFELTNEEFRSVISRYHRKYKSISGYESQTKPYCFKDYYIVLKGEKNQVYTRSLHAEENSFLQLAKYGGQGIEGGYLFTTASPCELCAKKAYQLGIKEIFYIDIYPGISASHILDCGERKPKMTHFSGVIGRAYERLYSPMIPLKDEIETITGIKVKKEKEDEMDKKTMQTETQSSSTVQQQSPQTNESTTPKAPIKPIEAKK